MIDEQSHDERHFTTERLTFNPNANYPSLRQNKHAFRIATASAWATEPAEKELPKHLRTLPLASLTIQANAPKLPTKAMSQLILRQVNWRRGPNRRGRVQNRRRKGQRPPYSNKIFEGSESQVNHWIGRRISNLENILIPNYPNKPTEVGYQRKKIHSFQKLHLAWITSSTQLPADQ